MLNCTTKVLAAREELRAIIEEGIRQEAADVTGRLNGATDGPGRRRDRPMQIDPNTPEIFHIGPARCDCFRDELVVPGVSKVCP